MQPELFAHRAAGVQVVIGIAIPVAFGIVTGLVLGVSELGYLGALGGWRRGRRTAPELAQP